MEARLASKGYVGEPHSSCPKRFTSYQPFESHLERHEYNWGVTGAVNCMGDDYVMEASW